MTPPPEQSSLVERLDEFDADEWFDVACKLNPTISREEFDETWQRFQREKAEHQRKAKLQKVTR